MARTSQIAVAFEADEKARIEAAADQHNVSSSLLLYMIISKATNNLNFFAIDFRDNVHIVTDTENQPA